MPRPGKIEKYELEAFVNNLYIKKKISFENIARKVNEKLKKDGINDTINKMTIQRFLERLPEKQIQEVKQDRRRIASTLNQQYDIIQSQLRVSHKMYMQLDTLEDFPDQLEEIQKQIMEIVERTQGEATVKAINMFWDQSKKELKKYIYELSIINREVRANNEFLTKLQEKIYEFGLVQQFINLFLESFRKQSPEAFSIAIAEVTSNPQMKKLVEQQMMFGGGDD